MSHGMHQGLWGLTLTCTPKMLQEQATTFMWVGVGGFYSHAGGSGHFFTHAIGIRYERKRNAMAFAELSYVLIVFLHSSSVTALFRSRTLV